MRIALPVESAAVALPLHAPDGFFSLPVSIAGWICSVAVIALAIRRTNRELNERMVPLMGVLAAFIFAAQMLNFPVMGGTSGHFVGGALAALLLGPWAAVLVMTSVVALQALIFQDGGLVVMGCNILNMGILSVFSAYLVFQAARKINANFSFMLIAGFLASWVSVEVGAIAASIQLVLSGTSPFSVALPAMGGIHALIGIGEGLITAGALSFVRAARRELIPSGFVSLKEVTRS